MSKNIITFIVLGIIIAIAVILVFTTPIRERFQTLKSSPTPSPTPEAKSLGEELYNNPGAQVPTNPFENTNPLSNTKTNPFKETIKNPFE